MKQFSDNLMALHCLGHCKRLAPAWGELGQSFENDSDVVVAHVDCTQAKKVCANAKVSQHQDCLSGCEYGFLPVTS